MSISKLKPFVISLKDKNPNLYNFLISQGKRFLGKELGVYPRLLGNELKAVENVLKSSQWNMTYGKGLPHEMLEEAFAEYIGVPFAIAVGSGGMALQMSMRALGLRPGDEVIMQIDTCSATAMAVINAGATPIFADISLTTFMLDEDSVLNQAGKNTKALIATHMWGNPENMSHYKRLCKKHNWILIEDACLGLGTIAQGRMAGCWGDVGVFSFGCLKPIQGGEGGMIVTADTNLAKTLRSMRHWGDRTIDFGERDITELSYNGRLSEIVAAVVAEQLKGYTPFLQHLQKAIKEFSEFIKTVPELDIVLGETTDTSDCSFSQVVLKINSSFNCSKEQLLVQLKAAGIPCWHANFELINTLSFFKQGIWKEWILKGDLYRIEENYNNTFKNAFEVYSHLGIGISKMNFLSQNNLNYLKSTINIIIKKSHQ
jgi:dTDP-4-amino-4,6-dideoxygalactose transaminase